MQIHSCCSPALSCCLTLITVTQCFRIHRRLVHFMRIISSVCPWFFLFIMKFFYADIRFSLSVWFFFLVWFLICVFYAHSSRFSLISYFFLSFSYQIVTSFAEFVSDNEQLAHSTVWIKFKLLWVERTPIVFLFLHLTEL